MTTNRAPWTIVCAASALGAAAVGGCGSTPSVDIASSSSSFTATLSDARFPSEQHVSAPADLRLSVRNTGRAAIPQLVVTIRTDGEDLPSGRGSFDILEGRQETRPVWITTPGYPKSLDGRSSAGAFTRAPAGDADTGLVSTYRFGTVPPSATRTMAWRVTPVRAGRYRVRYSLSAGTGGTATLRGAGGRDLAGRFTVDIAPREPTAP